MATTPPNDIITYGTYGACRDLPILTRGKLRVQWINLSDKMKGMAGNYYPDNPDNTNHLHLTVTERHIGVLENIFIAPAGALNSVCTKIPASTPKKQQIAALKLAMNRLYPIYEKGGFYDMRETMRALSQLSLDWLPNKKHSRQRQVPMINSDILIKLMEA